MTFMTETYFQKLIKKIVYVLKSLNFTDPFFILLDNIDLQLIMEYKISTLLLEMCPTKNELFLVYHS